MPQTNLKKKKLKAAPNCFEKCQSIVIGILDFWLTSFEIVCKWQCSWPCQK